MTPPPSFQFYPKDILSSGALGALSLEEIGAYTLLLCYDWQWVGLPMELKKLAKLLRISEKKMQKFWENLAEFFPEVEGRWMNPTLQIEREKQAARRLSLSENGKKGGRPLKADALSDESKRLTNDKLKQSLASSSAVASSSASATPVVTDICPEVPESAPSEPLVVVLRMPCIGNQKTWPVTQDQLDRWQETYRAADVPAELRKMASWLEANPDRRKTYKGVPRFIVRWLGKVQDEGGSSRPTVAPNRRMTAAEITQQNIEAMLGGSAQ